MADKPSKAGGFPSLKSTINELIKSKKIRQNILNLYKANQHKGFDCPGCAWGDDKSGAFKFCENGAKAIAWESTEKTVGAEFFARHSVSALRKQSDFWLESQGRLSEPLRFNRATDRYEPVSWDAAFDIIAEKIRSLSSPNELELYTSGRASNEASFLYQLFGRALGTNNFPDCSNMCHEASGIGLKRSIGVGKGTVVLQDFADADSIFVYGQNPGTNHPRMLNALRAAAKRGATIVSFNNLKEVGLERFASPQNSAELLGLTAVQISSRYYTPKLGGDYAVARGMAKAILADFADRLDQTFIQQHTLGFEEYCAQVRTTTWEEIEANSGLTQQEIIQAAELFVQSQKTISTWAMGITQHLHSVDTIHELTSLHLLTGAIGVAGGGVCPVRGHSNVQGNRTMGIMENPPAAFNQRMQATFQFSPPTQRGHRVFDALKAFEAGQSKVLICLGGNLAAAAADSAYTEASLMNAELSVNIATKLNRTHLTVANDALLLPCLGRTEIDRQASGEQVITVEDTFSMVHGSAGSTEPASQQLKSETEIVARIAQRTLQGQLLLDWDALIGDYDKIRNLIEQVVPGFDNVNRKIQQPGGFHLYNSAANREWNTASGKAEFNTRSLPQSLFPDEVSKRIREQSSPVFVLQTLRSHDQYNTTIYGMNDRYRGISGKRTVVFMNPADMAMLAIEEGAAVDLRTLWNDEQVRQVQQFTAVSYDIPQGNIACYYPEANPLVPFTSVGVDSATPTSKSVPVVVSPARQGFIPARVV